MLCSIFIYIYRSSCCKTTSNWNIRFDTCVSETLWLILELNSFLMLKNFAEIGGEQFHQFRHSLTASLFHRPVKSRPVMADRFKYIQRCCFTDGSSGSRGVPWSVELLSVISGLREQRSGAGASSVETLSSVQVQQTRSHVCTMVGGSLGRSVARRRLWDAAQWFSGFYYGVCVCVNTAVEFSNVCWPALDTQGKLGRWQKCHWTPEMVFFFFQVVVMSPFVHLYIFLFLYFLRC